MHLKSLTLRGFKSFASSTTLRFEPGVTAVVGPNGSGKSNVVDAIAWVLGEQGAKSLRGGKMEDVIFAGTPGRPPLGRAEVLLTIDNTDGALPIECSEVTVSRLMYRSGSSEYAINGSPCRLLDVQELLSDSGIGRELHVIVGQGQLDAVLSARPEDRRAFLEEAAGVLKHRRRKEKALRKLDSMAANLTRLTDLTAELRRQLGPLGRQAEVARRAAGIQADLRDARLRLLAEDLTELNATLAADLADETAARDQRSAAEAALADAVAVESRLEAAAVEASPRLAAANQIWYGLASLAEQVRGTARLAAERAGHLAVEPEHLRLTSDPDALSAEAAALRDRERALSAALAEESARLAAAVAERGTWEARLAESERRLVAAAAARADRRERRARLAGEVAAASTRRAATAEEVGRLQAAAAEADARRAQAEASFATLESEVAGLDAGELNLDADYEAASRALGTAEDRLTELADGERDVERQRAALTARRDALASALDRSDGAAALLASDEAGLLGSLSSLITVQPGAAAALAAALGAVADGVAVRDREVAVRALAQLRADDAGRVGLLLADVASPATGATRPALPAGACWAIDLVTPAAGVEAAVRRLLERVAVVSDAAAAGDLLGDGSGSAAELTVVTRSGEIFTAETAVGGSAAARSQLETREALAEVVAALREQEHRAERLRFATATAEEQRSAATEAAADALRRLHDSDARLAAVAERLGELGTAARAAAAEVDRLARAVRAAEAARDAAIQALAEQEARLAAVESDVVESAAALRPTDGRSDVEPSKAESSSPEVAERDQLAAEAQAARQTELEARLAVRTGEERVRALAGRADALLAAAAAERAARARAEQARQRRARRAARAGAVAAGAATLLGRIETAEQAAAAERDAAEAARAERERDLTGVRNRVRELTAAVEALTDAVHRDEVVRAELRLRIEAIADRAVQEYAVPAAELLVEFGPDVPLPPAQDGGELRRYDRAEQEARAQKAERGLARLGRVNPLALEEYAALEERHAFLVTQLEDLKATRRDLLAVVREVDERVEEVFAAAFADTAREFATVFRTLFPGGTGALTLTDPNDLLTSGIEVEARPAGKKVSRLSLLSGGERSLTAIAMLVAIFRARPSPFYVLDEVEAALDDRNLGRLLDLLAELRSASQLVIITHQKRTMEVADALYGVTMSGEGVTTVISQRLRQPMAASA
ncbi:MAG: chromosome segregation protein SMC [Frankiaceae bacterium]